MPIVLWDSGPQPEVRKVYWIRHTVPDGSGPRLAVIPSAQDSLVKGGSINFLVNWKHMHVYYSRQDFGYKDVGLQTKGFQA